MVTLAISSAEGESPAYLAQIGRFMPDAVEPNIVKLHDVFNLERQNTSLDAKLIATLDKLATVLRASLQEASRSFGLTPLQLQLLIFIAEHRGDQTYVSLLAEEFLVTKATISDSVKTLVGKKLLEKKPHPQDSRSHSLHLTREGQQLYKQLRSHPMTAMQSLRNLSEEEKSSILNVLLDLLTENLVLGNISSRACKTCAHFQQRRDGFFCLLLQRELPNAELRLDCPEHQKLNK